jgi:hypothetical protein
MVYNELNNWLNNKPQHGDVAYLIEPITDKRYIYVYRGPDNDPYSHLISDQFAADWFMKEVDKLKVEEPKMEKRCDNCKYFKKLSFKEMPMGTWCDHPDYTKPLVAEFTSCPKYEPKQQFTGPFDNLKFFVKDQQTGELEVKYVCKDCSKIMTKPFHWQLRVPFGANKDPDKRPGYYYWCEECWEKEKKK